jgi:hypothetical protein
MVAEAVQGSWVDTAQMGPVLTVTGRLRNPGAHPLRLAGVLQVVLLDSEGERLEHPPVLAGLALDRDGLRRLSLDVLNSAQSHAARALHATEIRPGSPLGFMAAIEEVPAQATRFEIEMVSPEEASLPWVTTAAVVPPEFAELEPGASVAEIAGESGPEQAEAQPAPQGEIGQESPAHTEAQPMPGS